LDRFHECFLLANRQRSSPPLSDALNFPLAGFNGGVTPCTDVAVSGARWFEAKRQQDPLCQAKAATVAEQCRTIGAMSGGPWFFENPVSVFGSIFGKPTYTLQPWHYTAYDPKTTIPSRCAFGPARGFSHAVFLANAPHLKTAANECAEAIPLWRANACAGRTIIFEIWREMVYGGCGSERSCSTEFANHPRSRLDCWSAFPPKSFDLRPVLAG